ncbi:hypothetical protein WG66_007112 [Moniliophthora roreri]|nr:hypothetical protein WG66_007112 [Moniliophthora roreri]
MGEVDTSSPNEWALQMKRIMLVCEPLRTPRLSSDMCDPSFLDRLGVMRQLNKRSSKNGER